MQLEPGGTVAPSSSPARSRLLTAGWTGWRHAAVCAALTLLAFLQAPGQIAADTKIDLLLNPLQWLERSLHLWDPSGSFGQVQNQAYGYLWPMGPFFAAGDAVGLPPWVVQRLWWAAVFCVAYLGAVRLAERLAIGTPTSRLIAGVAFALSPRILTQVGQVSVETWPSAVAPWVLIPLVGLATGGSIRRAVTLSALAVLCAGGVNATAVFATVPLAFLWLLTLQPLRRRLVAIAAWCAAVLAATAWWLVPLLMLSQYSPPFLDYIEDAVTTTWVTDPVTVLRGTSYWPAWIEDSYGPLIPPGWAIARDAIPAAGTMLLAAIGLAGLARRGMPHRRVLVAGLIVGFTFVSLGHAGQLPMSFNEEFRVLLDGALAPLRNMHKFDVIIRLPLTLGVAHLVGVLLRSRGTVATSPRGRRLGLATAAGTVAAVLAVASPALAGGLAAPRSFAEVPGYWRTAATWFNERPDEGRVMVIPGARFPRYTWGDTLDEITQPLLSGPVVVRNVIPLSPPTTIRMMDEVEYALSSGYGAPGLADYLARAGVSYLLVRNDIDYGRTDTTAPLLVHQALDRSPGLTEVASFGPDVETSRDGQADELGITVPALQVLRVDRPIERAVTYPAGEVTTVVGGPESMLWLANAGLLPAGPIVLAGDRAAGPALGGGPVIITDSLRLRDRSFGSGRDPNSTTLTPLEGADAHDLLPVWGRQWRTSAAYLGVTAIRASSSRSEMHTGGDARPDQLPFAVLDGDLTTSWTPKFGQPNPDQWVEVELTQARPLPEVTIHLAESPEGQVTRLTVDTETESITVDVTGPTVRVPLDDAAPTRTVRVTIDDFYESFEDKFIAGIAELEIPGVAAERTLVLPAPPTGTGPATVLLTAAAAIPSCFFGPTDSSSVDTPARCAAWVTRGSEDGSVLDRTITLAAPADYATTLWARPRAGAALDALLDSMVAAGPTVTASSSAFPEPAARPGAAIDGDPTTTWRAAPEDRAPELSFSWPTPQVLTGVRVSLTQAAGGALGTPVAGVTVFADGRAYQGALVDGQLRFAAPLTASAVTVRLQPGAGVRALNPYSDKASTLPVGVSEISFLGPDTPVAPTRLDLDQVVDLDCGSGPTLTIAGRTTETRLAATVRDLLQRRAVPATLCAANEGTALASGTSRVIAAPSDLAVATRIALVPTPPAAAATAVPTTVHIDQWESTRRLVTVAPHDEDLVLAVRENTNIGWRASIGGVTLSPIVVDGWQQGWVVPAGLSGQIELRYVPDSIYTGSLLGGAALALAIVVLALIPPRRRTSAGPATATRTGFLFPLVIGGVAFVVAAGLPGAMMVTVVLAALAYRSRGTRDLHRPWEWLPATGRWARLRPWVRHGLWLLPAVVFLAAGAAWVVVEQSNYHLLPQVVGILALGWLWLQTVVTAPKPR